MNVPVRSQDDSLRFIFVEFASDGNDKKKQVNSNKRAFSNLLFIRYT